MKAHRKLSSGLLILSLIFLASCGSMRNNEETLIADSREARETLSQKYAEVAELFSDSYAYAIFPNVGKGAYIIGGSSGNGTVYEEGRLVGYADMKQVDVGLQAGGKAFVEVVFFEDQETLEDFKDGSYELAANASAVILEEGVSRDVDFQEGVAVVTMPKAGAMAGVSVGGQRFDFHPLQN